MPAVVPLPGQASNDVPAIALSTAISPVAPIAVATTSPSRHWVTSAEWSGRSYRWSAQRGPLDIGLAFDASDPALAPVELSREASAVLVPTLPTISLGLRRGGPADASTLLQRAFGAADGNGASVSRVGIEWKPAQPQVNFLREGLGVRLDGNDRMTVRLRKGMIGIYMHRKF